MSKYDWQKLSDSLLEGQFGSMLEASKYLGIPYGTVYDAFGRGDLPANLVEAQSSFGFTEKEAPPEGDKVTIRKQGNEAILKFQNAEPISAEEAMEIAGIDKDEWRIVDQRVNMWQMGRKHKIVDLTWVKGKANGFVDDDGTIKKEYLYQIEVKVTRKNRVAVKTTLKPIEISMPEFYSPWPSTKISPETSVLFITDPHFGYVKRLPETHSIHHRPFLSSLLEISRRIMPDITVWNGDVLDMADWSSFDTEPGLMFSTQLAGMELGWVLGQFRLYTNRQVLLEGNHEQRLERMITKNLKAAFQLTPIHELDGEPLLSVPRFLGLKSLNTEWVGNYPSGSFRIGSVKFSHGNVVRKGSGKTISSQIAEATGDRFFGHIHRFEIAQKYVEDEGRSIWVGSPGCATNKHLTPGSDENHNWQLGAFLVHIENGHVASVEHIRGDQNGTTWFRGEAIKAESYFQGFLAQLPSKYRGQY